MKRWKGPVAERLNMKYVAGSLEHEEYKTKQKKHYYATKDTQRARANERVQAKRRLNQQWLMNYLQGKNCLGCGLDDVRLLTFNHIDPKTKFANIADIVSRGAKLIHLINEVEKCHILCHNCHMLVTFEQMGGSFREYTKPIPTDELNELIKSAGTKNSTL
jgi:hypothetical protein